MPGLGTGMGGYMGGDTSVTQPTVTNDTAKGIVQSLFPPGNLYDFDNPDANVFKILAAFGQGVKLFGFDVHDRLVAEFNPANVLEKLPDWETALNLLPGSGNALSGRTTTQRRTAIVSRLRESGASTPANIRAAIAPVLGYAEVTDLEVLEVDRDALRAAHTYSDTATYTVADGSSKTYTFTIMDEGVAAAGAQFYLVSTEAIGVSVTITAPSGETATIPGTYSLPTGMYFYAFTDFQEAEVSGVWTVLVENDSGSSTDLSDAALFVEGLGPGGLGGGIYYWGIYADPALVNSPDYLAAMASLIRMNPAHARGFLILSEDPWPDEESGIHAAIPDAAIPA